MNGVIAASGRYKGIEIFSLDISSEENEVNAIFFSPDGSKMYIVGWQRDTVFQYSLSIPWDITTSVYDDLSLNVSAQNPFPVGLSFNVDGTKMYLLNATTDVIYQYSLAVSWDISSGTYDNVSFNITPQESSSSDFYFRSDGLKLFLVGGGDPTTHQYSLSTPWDISTLSFDNISINTDEDLFPNAVYFRDDGSSFYIIGTSDAIHMYSLSTPWDISTVSYSGSSYDLVNIENTIKGMFFSTDGGNLYIVGEEKDRVFQIKLSSNWAIPN